ncbi:Transposon Ty3-G Gag-Pol polyprotein [Gossypium australe]|uniref:Transposon Ty3-G Gag-Pol polyprotein n=1 Tax=Gossypium australe TaxID=47621 RepID=A0A5B6VAB9_9ROSI|nr:Transposon Ty3-G Gag-Pol polyprotein [Gossypium australe]
MEYRSLLFQTEILDSHPDSRISCKKRWVHSFISALLSILRLMNNPNITPLYWMELNEKKIHGVDLIREAEEKVKVIRDSLKAVSDRQKSYADLKRKEIEFQVGDKFGCTGKPSPRFIGPYEIIEKIRPIAYRLVLAPELDRIHNPDMTYSEEPIRILAHETKELRNKKVALVKVIWQ